MTYFRTCIGCKSREDCPTKDALKASIKGLGLTSIKHRCKNRVEMFQKGDPVVVRTYSGYSEPSDSGYGNDAVHDDYPGYFIRQNAAKALVIVKPGTHGHDYGESFPFLPKNASGYLSIPLSRIRANPEGERVSMDECQRCGEIVAIQGSNARCEENHGWEPDCFFKKTPTSGDRTSSPPDQRELEPK